MIKSKQLFIKYLKDNNVYEHFVFNFNKREGYRNKECPKSRFFSETKREQYIDKAFSWSSTIEGHEFWFRISLKWKQHYSKTIKAIQYELDF